MPVVTQSRDLTVPVHWTAHLNGVDVDGLHFPNGGHQTTTSYRSKNRPSGKELEYNALSGPQLREQLGHEYRTRYDNGNEFNSKRILHVYPFHTAHVVKQDGDQPPIEWYNGPIGIATPDWQFTDFDIVEPTSTEWKVDGAKCISQTLPNAPQAALTQFLLELREQFPHIWGTAVLKKGLNIKQRSNAAADEYLNQEFGVKPFLSDLQKLGFAIKHMHKLVRQFERNSEAVVRRRTTLYQTGQDTLETTVSTFPITSGIGQSRFIQSAGTTSYADLIQREAWFSGAYAYHLDKGSNFLEKLEYHARQADYLLGTDFNVSTFWEIVPWSWLADWFSDAGTFLRNITYLAQDNLVLRYGYVMHTFTQTRNLVQRNIIPRFLWRGVPESMSQQCVYTIKTRHRATPYGFGLDLGTLSPRQWAILAALGLTRSDGELRRRVS